MNNLRIDCCFTMVFLFSTLLNANLDLRNKIGEMLIVGFHDNQFNEASLIAEDIQKYHIGGVILFAKTEFGGISSNERNIINPTQLRVMVEKLQSHAKKYRKLDEGELFIGIDHEGGYVTRLTKEKGFVFEDKSAKELGKINNVDYTFEYAQNLGSYLKELGINLNFAPVVDLAVNVDNFIYKKERCFSDDPQIVYEHAHAFVKGMQRNGITTVLKHFPGHGSSTRDTHKGFVDITDTWTEKELEPYQKFIDNNYVDMIMMSHTTNNQLDETSLPATFSKKIVNLLRKKMGFQGVVVSDDLCMGAIANEYGLSDTLKHTINSGIDMLILSNHAEDQTKAAVDIIEQLVTQGEISYERIEEAYQRIIRLKTEKAPSKIDL